MRLTLALALLSVLTACTLCQGKDTSFEANWMERLLPVLGNQSLLNLTLPGTHDTLTVDMSTTVSDNSNDMSSALSWILHTIAQYINILDVGYFIRQRAITQGINITQQLDSGIRFLDFRITYSRGPQKTDPSAPYHWYCLHMVESNQRAMAYLAEIRTWMDQHPSEIIVIWFSHHGDQGADNPYEVPALVQQQFWGNFTQLFTGILYNFKEQGPLANNTLNKMIAVNQRVVVYAGSYQNMTLNFPNVALSDTNIDNDCTCSDSSLQISLQQANRCFAAAGARIKANIDKNPNMLYLVSLAGESTDNQITYAAELTYISWMIDADAARRNCSAISNIPNMTQYCPLTLQELGLMQNYYLQIAFENAIEKEYQLPNAFYLDGVDLNGTFRVGPQYWNVNGFLPPNPSNEPTRINSDARYGYVQVISLSNIRRVCPSTLKALQRNLTLSAECVAAESLVQSRRKLFPINRWQDDYFGRQAVWPQ